ncbi:hypothetical protein SDC9_66564 [bioreactor metagenome]|uniref:Uncharacterized protein n=1 Tax=bioreactor metagenome TaxID=1076179 RepID=A0A644XVD2_9ZZZZ
MNKELQNFENQIKRKHSFGFPPKYSETFTVKLKPRTFIEIAINAIEKLGWTLVFRDEMQIEAKKERDFGGASEKITLTIDHIGNVVVKSVTLGSEIWDFGKNSKRVKLFIFAFNQELDELDAVKITELEKDIEKKDNWEDYVIPETLPEPKRYKSPSIIYPLAGTVILSLLLSYIIAALSISGAYLMILFEVGVGFIFGLAINYFLRLGNFTDFNKLKFVLGLGVVLTYSLNQYFQFRLILSQNNYESIGFIEFLKIRVEQGLTINSINTGVVGLIISWIVQLGLSYFIGYVKVLSGVLKYSVERVPQEVIEFALFHFNKGKNEIAVKHELSKMGWKDPMHQEFVMEAIGGIKGGIELSRME